MPDDRRPPTIREALRYFFRLLLVIKPYWRPLAQGVAMTSVLGALTVITPVFSRTLIDRAYPTGDHSLMHVLVMGLLGLTLASTLLGALSSFYSLVVSTKMNAATRLMYFNHLQHLDARFFDDHRIGDLTSRFQDLGTSLGTADTVFQTIFTQGFYLLAVPPLLFWLDSRLALVALLGYPLTALITTLTGRVLRRCWRRSAEATADLNAYHIETLTHIRTTKAMALEPSVFAKAQTLSATLVSRQVAAHGLGQMVSASNGVIRALNSTAYVWYGWTRVLSHHMSLGDFMAFSAYVGYLYRPISDFVALTSTFQQSAISLSRAFEFLDQPPEQDPTTAYTRPAPPVRRLTGHFAFERVSFSYVRGRPVLTHLDLDIPAGSVTALVGASGCGKTTVLRMLLRFAAPQHGRILIDGLPSDRFPVSALRRQIATVWQDVSLISGTLWENLTLGAEQPPSRRTVDTAVDVCALTDLVDSLPHGYRTDVAEFGATLSAGQRQRVALARALIRDAPVLLLDESTANLDPQTETRLLRNLLRHSSSRTVVLVTHRLANAALADRICVLANGQLVESGAHHELADHCRLYQNMLAAAEVPESRVLPN